MKGKLCSQVENLLLHYLTASVLQRDEQIGPNVCERRHTTGRAGSKCLKNEPVGANQDVYAAGEVFAMALHRLRRVLDAAKAIGRERSDDVRRELVPRACGDGVCVCRSISPRSQDSTIVLEYLLVGVGVVVGHDGGDPVDAPREHSLREAHRPARVRPPDVGDHGNTAARRLDSGRNDRHQLVVIEQRAFSGRPAWHHSVDALLNQPVDMRMERVAVELTAVVERRQESHDDRRFAGHLHDGIPSTTHGIGASTLYSPLELRLRLVCSDIDSLTAWQLGAGVPSEPRDALLIPRTTVALADGGTVGSWQLSLSAADVWPADVTAEVEFDLQGESGSHVLWPTYYGIVERQPLTEKRERDFRGPGQTLHELPDDKRLALPMAVIESERGYWLVGTDPRFSSTFSFHPQPNNALTIGAGWRWLAAAGTHQDETRRIFVVPAQDLRSALDLWFQLATPEIPAGPNWLHDIALQNFDYLAKSGRGWFADVDAITELVDPSERHKAIVTLHGWYDEIGRYCYNPVEKRLDEKWVAFPLANSVRGAVRTISHPVVPGIPSGPANHGWRNVEKLQPVPMSWNDLRDRLRYAKSQGLRTAFYVLTGMLAAGDPAVAIAKGTGLEIKPHWPGGWWQGPDLQGPAYVKNPLHPAVRETVLGYISAVLEEVGDLTDALVMDESYYVRRGALGPSACPGYADRAQADLIRGIAGLCHAFRSDLAFLTSDELGMHFLKYEVYPYTLFADGIYHDAWCLPESWDCVRFPTWRNTAWSVNWAPVTNLAWTRWSVITHNAPIAISNGNFGDDTGIAEFDETTAALVKELWELRAPRVRHKPLDIADID